MVCLSRKDRVMNIFERKKQTLKKRWNLFAEIEIKDEKLICQKENYTIDELCATYGRLYNPQYCTLKNGETYSINML